ncbi:dihydroxyacetone kinase subunit DhaL [Methylocaldum szegediense]|uniref:PEP-dependent dihydroxyacetone kinase 1, ADP-binding subunit DhaL n=1 Tax=Methylocaldum szegediense TaxID=73780 RepID=A0ABN8X8N2_9GAMM|nr:dihydroxyacetone kinase subunit DhaL [Methylocaldum szegediense]CAI8943806.1 PEP-dependent dihydroxyacetone kinase 1, ADP-binding subunit DhaL [Methylocaldum szegediense]
MSASSTQIKAYIQAADAVIREHAEEVAALDQAIGDGDHVANLQRGLAALDSITEELGRMDWSAAFQKIGMNLMSSVGGASGSLYGTLFLAMSKAMKDKDMSLPNLADAFGKGVEAMKQRGKADLGEKTMLDVLIPVTNALRQAAQESWDLPKTLETLNQVAETGCESTRDMIATKGRASFLGERARGHIDAGARTSQLIIKAITDVVAKNSSPAT